MKKLIIVIITLLISFQTEISSQDECSTMMEIGDLPTLEEALMDDVILPDGFMDLGVELPVTIHIIRDDNGNGGISENEAIGTIGQQLNTFYLNYNISFSVKEVLEIRNSLWYSDPAAADDDRDIIRSTDNDPFAIDLYYIPHILPRSSFPTSNVQGILMSSLNIVTNNQYNILYHEFGHYLFLFHTFESIYGEHCDGDIDNCQTKGDLVCDTPTETFITDGYLDANCIPHKVNKDSCGNTVIPDYTNIMSYNAGQCLDHFTQEQTVRMFKAIYKYYPHLYKQPVTFRNENNNDGTDLGGSFTVGNETVFSNTQIPLEKYSEVTAMTDDERFGSLKHDNWNSAATEYKLSYDFQVNPNDIVQRAKFVPLNYSKIGIKVEGIEINSGRVSFHDPWYVNQSGNQPDDFIEFDAPYEPNGKEGAAEKGVFLNQGDINNLTPPYYSVSIAQDQIADIDGSNRKIYFTGWGSNGKANFESAMQHRAVLYLHKAVRKFMQTTRVLY
jgi:hypothetical protein